MTKLNTYWIRGLKGKEKEDFEAYIRNSQQIFEMLHKFIQDREIEIYESEGSEESYSGDWAYLQAHRNGRKQELQTLKKLCQHIED